MSIGNACHDGKAQAMAGLRVFNLLADSHLEQRVSLNLLKYLANDQISIVVVGTDDAPSPFRPTRKCPAASRRSSFRAGLKANICADCYAHLNRPCRCVRVPTFPCVR